MRSNGKRFWLSKKFTVKTILFSILSLLFFTIFQTPLVAAEIKNGDFETGDFTYWQDVAGDARVISSQGSLLPRQGNYMGIITTGSGSIDDIKSYIVSDKFYVANATDTISFYWNFLSNEYPTYVGSDYNDNFKVKLFTSDGEKIKIVNSKSINSTLWKDSSSGYNGETGWSKYELPLDDYIGQNIWLQFTIKDVGDAAVDSALLIDDINVSGLEDDHGDSFFEATTIGANDEVYNSHITYPGDIDYFKVQINDYGTLKAYSQGSTNIDAELYDENYNFVDVDVLKDDISYWNKNFKIKSYLKPGVYYLAVSHHKDLKTGVYHLRTEFSKDDDLTAYLFLHGLNSEPKAWKKVLKKLFNTNYSDVTIYSSSVSLPLTNRPCYALNFGSKDGWDNGDGMSFSELGEEVGVACSLIQEDVVPNSIILVGHSRGGLAARAFIQSLTSPPPYKLGLLTITTPHLGSPLGRTKLWLDDNDKSINNIDNFLDIPTWIWPGSYDFSYEKAKFLFCPSTGMLATNHDEYGDYDISATTEINNLNNNISKLNSYVSSYGQLICKGIKIGDKMMDIGDINIEYVPDPDLIKSDPNFKWLMKATTDLSKAEIKELEKYIFENISWLDTKWKYGDGIVPNVSQNMKKIPNFDPGDFGFHTQKRSEVTHIEANTLYNNIESLLEKMKEDLD